MKVSNYASGLNVTPGTQIVNKISTGSLLGSNNSARLLAEIAKNNSGGRIYREFPSDWSFDGDVATKTGVISFGNRKFPLTIQVGKTDFDGAGKLVFEDGDGDICSMKTDGNSKLIEVGERLSGNRIKSLACQVIGTWIVHGKNWLNRRNELFRDPWGATKRGMFETFSFEVIDGALENPRPTIGQLIERGCRRSTHVGEWSLRHSTIIPAIAGMPMTIHEFKSNGGDDICKFNDLQIGLNPGIWGPYCPWNEAVRHSDNLGMWKDLALRSATPFSFHVHATRTLFPEIQLDSDLLLQSVGVEKLRGVLELMVANQPGRFYRLIDERGNTYRQTGASDEELLYGDDYFFDRSRVVDNVMQNFLELQALQNNPALVLPRRCRLVIDSHAYIVIEAMARRQKEAYELSGRFMHKYLTDGTDALMHRVRNEELFLLLRDLFGLKTMKFHVYPPLTYDSGLKSQYDQDLQHFRKEAWLTQEVK